MTLTDFIRILVRLAKHFVAITEKELKKVKSDK